MPKQLARELSSSRTAPDGGSGRLAGLVWLTFWLQPLGIHTVGVPIATFTYAAVVCFLFATGFVRARPLTITAPAWVSLALTLWAVGLLYLGRDFASVADPLTLFLIILTAPLLVSNRDEALAALSWATRVVVLGSACAVILQVYVSPTLFGLIESSTAGIRPTGLHYNANGGALFLLLALMMRWPLLWHSRGRVASEVSLQVLGLWALWQMSSRGALLAVLGGAAIYIVLRAMRKSISDAPLWLMLITAVLLIGIGGTSFLDRVGTAFSEDASSVLSRDTAGDASGQRYAIWGSAVRQLKASPLAGPDEIRFPFGVDNAHNAFLEAALNYGIVGAILFVALLISCLHRILRRGISTGDRVGREVGVLALTAAVLYGMTHLGVINNSFLWIPLAWFAADLSRKEGPVASEDSGRRA